MINHAPKSMSHWFYYNIFRFECFIRAIFYYPSYVFFKRPIVSDISDERDKDDIFLEQLSVELKQGTGMAASRIVAMTMIFLFVTPWNLICGLFHINNLTIWMTGWALASIAALFTNIKAASPSKYLKDFRKQELRSGTNFKRSAIRAFLIMIGIWTIFILSSMYFLSNSRI